MSEAVQVALIVGVLGLLGSLGLAFITGTLQARRDRLAAELTEEAKEAEWKRQDEVSSRLVKAQLANAAATEEVAKVAAANVVATEEVAKLAAEAASANAVATEEVAKVAAEAASAVKSQLVDITSAVAEGLNTTHDIHTLVNSDMTEARTAELTVTKLVVIALQRVIGQDREAGRAAEPSDIEAIETARGRITELQTIIADRHAQQLRVEQAAADRMGQQSATRTPN